MKIVLATTSPYRIDAMKLTGIDFEAKGSNVEEKFDGRPDDHIELVKCLSKLKAESVAKDYVDSLVIGFDSVADFEGKILEKPKSYEEAFERLKSFSGKIHRYITGITLINTRTKEVRQDIAITKSEFRKISDEEIKNYLDNDPRYKTIGLGYDPIGHISMTFIKNIEGEPINLQQGIPLSKIVEMIREAEE